MNNSWSWALFRSSMNLPLSPRSATRVIQYHTASFFTSVVTVSSICLSVNPSSEWLVSFPKSVCKVTNISTLLESRLGQLNIGVGGRRRSGQVSRKNAPYLAYTLGKVPAASRSMMGVLGLFFFMVGYARVRNALWFTTSR